MKSENQRILYIGKIGKLRAPVSSRSGRSPLAWDSSIDDETPGGDSTANFAGLETGWNRPGLTTQEPIYK